MNSTPFLEALSKEINMDVTLSGSGAAAFVLDGHGLLLQWQESSQSFVVYVEIGALAGWRDGEVCRTLLSANFLLLATRGGAFSYDQSTNTVGLNYTMPVYGLEPQNFLEQLNGIILLAEECRAMFTQLTATQENAVLQDQKRVESGTGTPAASNGALRIYDNTAPMEPAGIPMTYLRV